MSKFIMSEQVDVVLQNINTGETVFKGKSLPYTVTKVTKTVAEFIKRYEENAGSHEGWKDNLLHDHTRAYFDRYDGCPENTLCMKHITPMKLAEILVNGYEIELTPEEKVLARYQELDKKHDSITSKSNWDLDAGNRNMILILQSEMSGIRAVLEDLGLKIEGVNV